MARTKGPSRKSVTVGLSEGVFAAADEQRWTERMTFSEFVNHAVTEYLSSKGIKVTEPEVPAEVPAEVPGEKGEKAAQKA